MFELAYKINYEIDLTPFKIKLSVYIVTKHFFSFCKKVIF